MRKATEKLMLECVLTDKEKLEYAKTQSEKISEQKRLEDSLKSVSTQMKAEITACEAIINSIADKINTGKEHREVICDIEYDFTKKQRSWIRKDTKKIAKVTDIPPEEMQEELG